MMALTLMACSNTESEAEPVANDTNEVVEVDTNVYVTLGTDELDLETLVLPLDDYDYVSIEINEDKSDYDLTVAGEYTLVLILTDEDGNTTEVALTLVVDTEEVLEEEVAEQLTTKLTSKDTTLSTVETLTSVVNEEEIVDDSVTSQLTTKLSSKDVTLSATKYQVFITPQLVIKLTSKDTTLDYLASLIVVEEETTSSSSYYSSSYSSSWNGGLNTDPTVYGLDPDNVWVQEAMKLLGKEGLCMWIAADLYNAAYEILYDSWPSSSYASGLTWDAVSAQLEIGDIVYYNYMKSGSNTIKSHVAIYLGNGLALHGNWTGGVARISYVYQEAQSYNLASTTHTVTKSGIDWSSLTPEETLERLGIDYSGMSLETTCPVVAEKLRNEESVLDYEDEFIFCIEFGYMDWD